MLLQGRLRSQYISKICELDRGSFLRKRKRKDTYVLRRGVELTEDAGC